MQKKHSIIAVQVIWAAILACALGTAYFRHDISLQSFVHYVLIVSLAVGILGFLYFVGGRGADLYPDYNVVDLKAAQRSNAKPDSRDKVGISRVGSGVIVMLAAGAMLFLSAIASLALRRN
jgi:hypothetical protein